jgi:Asp/Glu/hydantoin racemase
VYFTAPSGPASINNAEDGAESAEVCLPHLLPLLDAHDAFLVACYSAHPLVPALQARTRKPVTGILEASVGAALMLLRPGEAFGVVSTGSVWEQLLGDGIRDVLGANTPRFVGVTTTGLSAKELHEVSADVVRERMVDATRTLLRRGNVGAICLGCAGMAGMDEMIREAAVLELGDERGGDVRIVDGVVAGAGILHALGMHIVAVR